MGHWEDIRAVARAKRAEIAGAADLSGIMHAGKLLRMCEDAAGVLCIPLEEGDPLLYGADALLYTEGGESTIYYNDAVDERLALFYRAHEFAHLWLHHLHGPTEGSESTPVCAASDLDIEAPEAALPVGAGRVQGYGPKERREREANAFAREFLLPAGLLRRWYLEDGLDASRVARLTGLPVSLVYHQLTYALLAPDLSSTEPQAASPALSVDLDSSQRRAAHIRRGPLLLEAGPGTGKTRTLTARILYLLEQGVAPGSILSLTFSNKAAEEMRARVAAAAPVAASHMWMGTFHSFGLELLSKYGTRLGLPPRVRIIDPMDALLVLEQNLKSLGLRHYMNLYEPTMYLRNILGAISRAKDELVGPEAYEALGRAMLAEATEEGEDADPTRVEAAERALEVARVYRFYQAYLQREGLVDFGDLIARPVDLLKGHVDVRALVQGTFRHVLVDEFQDTNRASSVLLREIAGDGQGLWVVGDARQAIYRFRGAAPGNMHLFPAQYEGVTVLPLEVNYRSQPAIVDTFAEMAPQMRAARGTDFTPWRPQRPDEGGRVTLDIAEDDIAEGAGVAELVAQHRAQGVAYRDQAVLCRSHSSLARIGAALERAGVPTFYLGDLFEREEVRDLLSLIEISLESPHPTGALLRVARFPEYNIPLADATAVLGLAKDQDLSVTDAMAASLDSEDISDTGKVALAQLLGHLEACTSDTAWGMLARYLFSVSAYLRPLLAESTPSGLQRRLAIFQFLQFAREHRARGLHEGIDPRWHFLGYVRRLELFSEERALRQMPDWAEAVDAVRLLTVHASKGLEFRVVYLPALGNRYFPASRRHEPCPPPAGLLPAGEEDWHEEEEECLFFVALSRARDSLCLTHALKYGKQPSKPSRLLSLIAARLPAAESPRWLSADGNRREAILPVPEIKGRFSARMLELYMKCPRQFMYEYRLGLSGKGDDAAYLRFVRSVYRTVSFLRDEQEAGRDVSWEDLQSQLALVWEEEGMGGHAHEEIYREQAEQMLARAFERRVAMHRARRRPKWEVSLQYGNVYFTPDQIEDVPVPEGETAENPGPRVRLQRLRTGRFTEEEKKDPLYALYHAAAARAYPPGSYEVQALYLSVGEAVEIRLGEKALDTGLLKYDQAIAGILGGHFEPAPSDRRCPRCAHYFTCPAAEER